MQRRVSAMPWRDFKGIVAKIQAVQIYSLVRFPSRNYSFQWFVVELFITYISIRKVIKQQEFNFNSPSSISFLFLYFFFFLHSHIIVFVQYISLCDYREKRKRKKEKKRKKIFYSIQQPLFSLEFLCYLYIYICSYYAFH